MAGRNIDSSKMLALVAQQSTGFNPTGVPGSASNGSGAEAELTYNWHQPGYSSRLFFDTARGTLDAGGNLPLQAATRVGVEGAYAHGAWRSSLSVTHALQQTQLASFETDPTPEYTQVDAAWSLRDRFMG